MKRTPLRRDTPRARAFADARGRTLAHATRKPLARSQAIRRVALARKASDPRAAARREKQFGVSYAMLIRLLPCPACPEYRGLYADRRRTAQVVRAAFLMLLDYAGRGDLPPVLSEANHVVHSRGNDGGSPEGLCPTCHGHHTARGDSWHAAGRATFKQLHGVDLPIIATWIAETVEGKLLLSVDGRIAKARTLDVVKREPKSPHRDQYDVSRGERSHRVTVFNGPPLYFCDCPDFRKHPGGTCCHVAAVKLSRKEKARDLALAMVVERSAPWAGGAPIMAEA